MKSRIRAAGIATAVAAIVVAIVALTVGFLPPNAPATQYSYPSSAEVYSAYQVLYAVQHVVLAWGLLAVLWSGAAGAGRLGKIGAWGSAIAMVALGVLEAVAAAAATEPIDGDVAVGLSTAYGVVTLPLGAFLVVLGIAVLRARVWSGWQRLVVLITGIWVFIPLTPALAIDFTIARFALVLWMVLFLGIGIALSKRAERP